MVLLFYAENEFAQNLRIKQGRGAGISIIRTEAIGDRSCLFQP
jgi:hypothetical protein